MRAPIGVPDHHATLPDWAGAAQHQVQPTAALDLGAAHDASVSS